jgi:hypothetical protein
MSKFGALMLLLGVIIGELLIIILWLSYIAQELHH